MSFWKCQIWGKEKCLTIQKSEGGAWLYLEYKYNKLEYSRFIFLFFSNDLDRGMIQDFSKNWGLYLIPIIFYLEAFGRDMSYLLCNKCLYVFEWGYTRNMINILTCRTKALQWMFHYKYFNSDKYFNRATPLNETVEKSGNIRMIKQSQLYKKSLMSLWCKSLYDLKIREK